jgi:hypothetical protein
MTWNEYSKTNGYITKNILQIPYKNLFWGAVSKRVIKRINNLTTSKSVQLYSLSLEFSQRSKGKRSQICGNTREKIDF